MSIEAKIIADSIGEKSPRLTTFELRYPRFVHSEYMTHRMFSRNASSSRAIPVERQIAMIKEDTAMPIHWGMNQKGMQAAQESDALIYGDFCELDMIDNTLDGITAEQAWLKARDRAIEIAQGFVNAGYHKQVVNRILEPFSHIKVVCTATNYSNFFWLRRHKDAQPEIKVLADAMHTAMRESTPTLLSPTEWHVPYVSPADRGYVYDKYAEGLLWKPEYGDGNGVLLNPETILLRMSVARCARVSYDNHDGSRASVENDLLLYHRLVGSVPLHASPAEHQARTDDLCFTEGSGSLAEIATPKLAWANPNLSGNFDSGWVQFRKTLPHEAMRTPQFDEVFGG